MPASVGRGATSLATALLVCAVTATGIRSPMQTLLKSGPKPLLIILVASCVGVFCIAGWLPGHIAKSRGHPWAQAVTVAGWITLICGFALWPVVLIWAYVDVPARKAGEA